MRTEQQGHKCCQSTSAAKTSPGWEQLESYVQGKMNLDPGILPYKKFDWKWITDLHLKAETIKLLKENIGLEKIS